MFHVKDTFVQIRNTFSYSGQTAAVSIFTYHEHCMLDLQKLKMEFHSYLPVLHFHHLLLKSNVLQYRQTSPNSFSAWRDLPGHRHGKRFIGRPCKKRADDLLKLSRHQLKIVVAILTGQAIVRGHLYIMGLFEGDPTRRLEQCSISSAAARLWLISVITSLGIRLTYRKI
jgi:hypothetical protein